MSATIARRFRERNYKAHLFSRSEYGGITHSKVDMLSYQNAENSVEEANNQMGGLSAAVHAAGGFYGFTKLDEVNDGQSPS